MVVPTPTPDVKSAFVQLLRETPAVLAAVDGSTDHIVQDLDNVVWDGSSSYIAILGGGGRGRIGANRREKLHMVHVYAPWGWKAELICRTIIGEFDPGQPRLKSSFKARDTLFYSIMIGESSDSSDGSWKKRILPVYLRYGEHPVS